MPINSGLKNKEIGHGVKILHTYRLAYLYVYTYIYTNIHV